MDQQYQQRQGSKRGKDNFERSPMPGSQKMPKTDVSKPFSLSKQGSSNLLERVSQFAPAGSTAAESSSPSNPTEADFNKSFEFKKADIQQALKTFQSLSENEAFKTLRSELNKAKKAKEWQKAIDKLNSLAEFVENFIENQEVLEQEEEQENARKEEKDQQKRSGPTRASKISQEILKSKDFYLYRKMAREEANKILEKWGQTKGHKQQKALREVTAEDKGRKWLATTPEHSKTFSNENVDEGTNEVVIKIILDSQKYHKVLESRLPAYQAGSYDNRNKDKVLIHQERLAESNIANTKTESELEKIFTEKENYNVGFSEKNVGEIDNAIKEIQIIELETLTG